MVYKIGLIVVVLVIVVWATAMSLTLGALYARDNQLQQNIAAADTECDLSGVSSGITDANDSLLDLDGKVDRLRSDLLNTRVDIQRAVKPAECTQEVECPKCDDGDGEVWVELNGLWVVTHYGSNGDGFLGEKHGAAWSGLECKDHSALSTAMPDVVTVSHFGLAMPGPEWYCLPIKVCVNGVCAIGTAVDVMEDHRIKYEDDYYSHVDLWPMMAEALGVVEQGIVYSGTKVYVGVWE